LLRYLSDSVEHHHAHSKMKDLALFMVLRTLALSLFAVFIPIFFYKQGEPVWNIFFYFFVAYSAEAFFEIFSVRLFRKIGPKKTILFSVPFTLFFLYLLATYPDKGWPLWFLGLVVGFALAFFWQPYHYLFSKLKSGKMATTQVSVRTSVVSILNALGPIIGAFIIAWVGQGRLMVVSIVLMAIGSFFLIKKKDDKIREKFDLKDISLKKFKKPILAYMGFTWEETAAAVIWPFFIYTVFETYQSVGALTTATLLMSVTLTLVIGKASDHGKRQAFIKQGSHLNFIINIVRIVANNIYHIFVANFLKSFSTAIFYSPFVSEYYLHADEEVRDEFIYVMELATDISRVIFYGILVLASLFFPLKIVFIIALTLSAVGALVSGIMPATKRDPEALGAKIKIMPQPKKMRVK
jgi:MFS family permease